MIHNNTIPNRPVGNDNEAIFMQAVWDCLFGGKFPFVDRPGCEWNRTTAGYFPLIKTNPPGRAGQDWASPIVYDKDKSYRKGQLVVIRPTDAIVTAGAMDVDAEVNKKAVAGTWKATRNVRVGELLGSPAYQVPQWPLPTADDPDAENVYWWPMSFYPAVAGCDDDSATPLLGNAQPESS